MAIGVVVLLHMTGPLKFGKGGWIGVDVFFVLSGFLITSLLIGESATSSDGRVSLGRFYARRILRLWPAYVAFILAALICARVFHPGDFASWRHQLFVGLSYRMNFWNIDHIPHDGIGQVWSLCMEEQFYLVWPFVLLLLMRWVPTHWLLGLVTVGIIASCAENVVLASHHVSYRRLYFGPDTNAFSLLLGCLAGIALTAGYFDRLANTRFVRWFPAVFIVILLAWTATMSNTNDWVFAGPVEILCALSAVAIVSLVLAPDTSTGRLLAAPLMVKIGLLSYSIYLWNAVALSAGPVSGHGIAHLTLHYGLRLSLLVILPLLSYYFVEKPGLRIKRRFDKPSSREVKAPPVVAIATSPQPSISL
jgi:peptidoglycan/LPS O-acetylase OafA/YrhL